VNESLEYIELIKIRGRNSRKSDESIDDLTKSIRESGILEPLLVRKRGQFYELLAGARRLRAAENAGLKTVPIIVMEVSDEKASSSRLRRTCRERTFHLWKLEHF
jgi:ParB family chromosome partitioning protein